MHFAAAGSQEPDLATAISAAARTLIPNLGGNAVDLTVAFVSHHHQQQFSQVAARIQAELPSRVLLGVTAETVICGDREWETGPAIALWSASLPEYELRPFQVAFESTPDGVISTGIPDDLADDASRTRGILTLGEPYSSAPHALIERFADDCPGVPVVGGMASGASGPNENRLFFKDAEVMEGAIGVALLDGPPLRTMVSQGCRPIGEPFVVTKAEKNIILELGGLPSLARIQEVYQATPATDRKLLENGLLVGVAMTELRDSFRQGDFLVANVLGADRGSGAIAAGLPVRIGQTVQFHIRDAESADQDLAMMLQQVRCPGEARPAAGLLFSCNGRGSRMFPGLHHDAVAIQKELGPLPLAGMFAAGEIGPIGKHTYLHGYTASALFFPG